MTLAVAIRDSSLSWEKDYEPVTPDSNKLQRASQQWHLYLRGSASDWIPTIEGLLREIENDCTHENWDGEGAHRVSDATMRLTSEVARCLYALLPRGTPAPDLMPEADGEIAITWTVGDDRVFALSIGAHGKLNFAGKFGQEGSIHGWQPIDSTNRHSVEESLWEIARHICRLHAPITYKRILKRGDQ